MQYMKECLLKLDSKRYWTFTAFSSAPQELWVISSSEELNARGEFQKMILLFNKWHNKKKNVQA